MYSIHCVCKFVPSCMLLQLPPVLVNEVPPPRVSDLFTKCQVPGVFVQGKVSLIFLCQTTGDVILFHLADKVKC